ncbi:hypothetical protein H2684_03230 [Clostridium sp. cel8]|jgi:tRNA/tmRNA/rRNA uracil-C5-methylase (TrmA/RlmC/RlmD family)|uniref:hypothetical protein n=1 Tax=unclassified Clostridium TaxID=2614128 RepID=UPI0015F4A447|nr:hypothetical protein [Clostridium sp. cel8]MBA5850330.1 hypothetical protein [Clostridium sp. cel8]
MDSNKLFLKIIHKYEKMKKNKVVKLNKKIDKLHDEIEKENIKYKDLLKLRETVKIRKSETEYKYNMLIMILKSRGIIFEIQTKYSIKEWENLYIKFIDERYKLINKKGCIVYEIEDKYYSTIEHIIKNYKYSIVVIRKDAYFYKLQLRII